MSNDKKLQERIAQQMAVQKKILGDRPIPPHIERTIISNARKDLARGRVTKVNVGGKA